MARIKLTVEYDGTEYVGWQSQANAPSIQSELAKALKALLGEEVEPVAAGRTDSGVHAMGQVVAFSTEKALPLKAYWMGLNGLLPPDISVVKAEEVPADFDPRRWASGKRYRYLVSNRRARSPLRRRTHWELFSPLDVEAMAAEAPLLLGRHDFSAFRAADCQAKHAVRELTSLSVSGKSGDEIVFEVAGTAFLKHMVRNIVGSLVHIGKGRRPSGWLASVLEAKDRAQAGPTAPAHGLCLVEVFYDRRPPAAFEAETDEEE
jgi:tRNA pseudouridine38-40 synthase